MCGIFGWALGAAKHQDRKTLIGLTDLMFHRGPDGSGYWLHETSDERFQIGLGHRRLSIIDIGGGAQPMLSEDGRFTLNFNGEIYNYLELRQELVALGHRFRTNSDTEVLIEAYRAWHLDAVGRFRGMFGFALWDEAEQRLVLARDAFGKRRFWLVAQSFVTRGFQPDWFGGSKRSPDVVVSRQCRKAVVHIDGDHRRRPTLPEFEYLLGHPGRSQRLRCHDYCQHLASPKGLKNMRC